MKAQTFTVGDLNYSLNEDGATVTVTGHVDGTDATGNLVIPEAVEYYNTSYAVTIIADNAFNGCSNLTGALVLPETLSSIGSSAFRDCSGITGDLTIPDLVLYIGTDAFRNCSGFSGTLTVGSSVAKTGRSVFAYCNGFTTLNYNAVNCDLMDVHVYIGSLISIYSGSWNGQFWYNQYNNSYHWLIGCNSLTTLRIGEDVQRIPYCFLQNCNSFNGELIIPDNVRKIEWNAFNGCSGFSGSLIIPSLVWEIGDNAFANCNGFSALQFNAIKCTSMSSSWLAGVDALTSLSIGENVQRIPDDFVNGFSSITGSLVIPNEVTYIGANAFSSCSGLSGSLTLGSSLVNIGNSAFFGACEYFNSFVVLTETPPTLGSNVFISFDYNNPVTVPSCSSGAYQNASGWDVFTNIQEASACMREITATANPSDGGTIEGAGTYEQGSICALTATPNADYAFVNWTENGEEVSADMEYSFEVWDNREITANFRYIRYEITALAIPGEGGTVEGAGSFLEGETCTLTATPSGYYYFVNWTENGEEVSADAEYTFTVTEDRTIEAHFALPMHSIVASVNPNDAGFVEFNGSTVFDFDDGTLQGWTTVDADGDGRSWNSGSYSNLGNGHSGSYYAISWSWNGSAYNPDNYLISPELYNAYSITYYVAVNTSYPDHYAVYASTTGNDISDFNYYVYEETPTSKGIGEGGRVSSTDESPRAMSQWFERTIELPAGTKYVAFRHFNSYDMNYLLIDDVAIKCQGISYTLGETCVVTAIPNPGYAFVNWQENGEVVSTDAEYSFTVLEDRNLVANFTPVYEVSVNVEEGGTVEGTGSYLEGETCTLTAIPNEEWAFVNWIEDGEEVSTDIEYTFTVTGNRDLVANFRNIRHEIYVSVKPENGGVVNVAKDGTWDQWYYYDNGDNWGGAGNDGGLFWWGVMFPAGSYDGNQVAKVAAYDYFSMTGTLTIYNDGADAPANPVANRDVTFTGSRDFVEFGFDSPAWVDPSKNLWIVFAYTGGSHYPAAYCSYTGDPNSAYFSWDGSSWQAVAEMWDITFMIRLLMTEAQPIGSFLEGETCTLTATPNEGWAFYNWWENGEIVSTEADYSFTVTSDRSLLVRFKNPNTIDFVDPKVEAICVSLWDTDGDGFISYEEAAAVTDLGNVFQSNTEITSFDELQYFTGLTSIADNAFHGCSSLVSVTFPEGITTIGSGAFQDCVSLTGDLVIPNSVVTIGDYAYRECAALTSLTIGNSVTYIGHNAFYHCYGMSGELTIPNSVETIGIGVFIDCGFTGTLTLGSGLTSIGNAAFRRLNVDEVHWNAVNCSFAGDNWDAPIFAECYNLSTLVFADDVVTIPEYAFLNCSSLTGELILPSSLTYIGGCAFYGCSSLTGSLVIPDAVEYIGWESFSNTGFNGTLTIGQSVSQIDGGAFDYTGFTALDYRATNCNYVEISYMNDNASVFYVINTVVFGENVESIPSRAFRGCDSFTGTLTLPNSLKSIGEQAFYNCYGFDGIVFGNAIETIGNEAFRNCGGFRGELTLPESLQFVGTYAFAGCDEINTVNYNAINCNEMGNAQQPVFFDCASIEHINIGSAVESIPNYAFKRCSNVTDMHTAATVPPVIQASTFAAVPRSIPVLVPSGSGDAYRSAQYWEEFFNIMEDGEQYSFYWDVDAHQYAHNLSVIGLVQINGEEQSSPAIEIGAFCGDECRGRQMLTAYPDLNRSLVFLTVFGEEGDLITFRLYDHEAEEESTLACATVLTFEADAVVGSYNEPEVLNFVEMQNTAVEAGWTWFSTYIDADGAELLQMMEESLGGNGIMIKSLTDGFVSNDEYGWEGTLTTVNTESMYMVNTTAPAVVSLAGPFADASEHPVTLSPEWNWIGYPANRAASLNNALSGFTAQDGDIIKMQESFSQYVEGIGWTGALKTLVPGEGLMYRSLNSGTTTLTYMLNAKDGALEENLAGAHWTANAKAYPYNMSVVAVVEIDGMEASDGRYELAAFANGECRGSVRLTEVEALDRYMAFLTVSGNGATDLEWALYDSETGMEYRGSMTKLQFEQNGIVGSAREPLTVRFGDLTGTDETMNQVSCYPNPANRGQYFRVSLPASKEARVDVVNALGATVSSQRVNGPAAEVKAPTAAGVYMLRVTIDGKAVATTKLIVE